MLMESDIQTRQKGLSFVQGIQAKLSPGKVLLPLG